MYSNLIMLMILVLPIPILVRGLRKGDNPFRVILEGAVLAGVGIAFVFILAQLSGNSLGEEVDKTIRAVSKILAENQQMTHTMGLQDSSKAERIDYYKKIYDMGAQIIPAVLLIIAVVVSYLEGLILGKALKKGGAPINPIPPFREFNLPKNSIMGWFAIFVLSWILKAMHFNGGEFILANVNVLFQFTFALQGIALAMMFAYLKKIPKAIPVIVIIILLFTSIGQLLLFFIGIVDLIAGLKKRIQPR